MQDDRKPEGVRPPDDPRYPPHSVLRREVRRSAVVTYVGGLVVLFALIGAGMLYWAMQDKERVDPTVPQAVGTVGSARGGLGETPGGFDPQRRPGDARAELEQRGAGGSAQGPMPALHSDAALTRIGQVLEGAPASIVGRQVDLRDVEVESGDARSFWIRDGNAKLAVIAPTGQVAVLPGRNVDIKGVAELDGTGGVRVRAAEVGID